MKPNTWCQKMPRKICAPDNCNMVQVNNNDVFSINRIPDLFSQGPESCRDKMMVSTIQKPEEHCELQPQRHCRLITKLVPHLTTKEVGVVVFLGTPLNLGPLRDLPCPQVCNTVPKEICMLKLINPHPVKKPIQLKWCTKKKPEVRTYLRWSKNVNMRL